jgi:hypothetical protein
MSSSKEMFELTDGQNINSIDLIGCKRNWIEKSD